MKKIGICLNFEDELRLKQIEDFCIEKGFTPKFMDLKHLDMDFIRECEVLFGFFPRRIFKEAVNLKWFHCSYAGVDKFSDNSIYYSPDVILTNSRGAYGLTISEHMLCVTLMMMRRMPSYIDNQRASNWEELGDISSIYGSKCCVIGLGDIGSNFAKRLKAMGAYVKAVRNHKNVPSPYADEIFGPDEIDDAVKDCDLVALCMPSTRETEHTMTEERLKALKKGAYFINVGRGTAVDQDALCRLLREGHLAGAALDVFLHEPIKSDDEIWNTPNLIITPHVAGSTNLPLSRDNVVNIFKENMEHYLKGEKLKNVIDKSQGY